MNDKNLDCRYTVNNLLELGPIRQKTCCAFQGYSSQGRPRYGFCKTIPLPYVNYSMNEQRSPYDNDPWRYRQYLVEDTNYKFRNPTVQKSFR